MADTPLTDSSEVLLAQAVESKYELARRNRSLMGQIRNLEQRTKEEAAAHDAQLKEWKQRDADYQKLHLALDAAQRQAITQRASADSQLRSAHREIDRLNDELRTEKRRTTEHETLHARLEKNFEEFKARYEEEKKGRWVRTARSLEERERELAAARSALASLQRKADDYARRHDREAAELKGLFDEHRQRAEARLKRVEDALQRRLDQANKMLHHERATRETLQAEKDAVDSELRRSHNQFFAERAKLDRDLRETKEQVTRLLDARTKLESEVHKLEAVAGKVSELEYEHAIAEKNVHKLQADLKFAKEQCERAEADKKEERNGRRRLEEELRVVRAQLEDLHTRSRSQRAESDAARRAALDEDHLRKVLREKEALEIRLSHAAIKEESTYARLEELTRGREALEKESDKLHRERERLRRELKEGERKAESEHQRRTDLELEVKRLERELEEAHRKARESQGVDKNTGADVSAAGVDERKVRELEKRWESERRERDEKEREVRRLKGLVDELEGKQEELQTRERREASVREKNVARELEEARAQADKLKRDLEAERQRREKAEQHSLDADKLAKEWEKKFKAGLGSANGASDALKSEVTQLSEKLKREGERVKEAEAKARKLGDDLAKLDDDLEDLRSANAKLDKEKKLLQVEKEDLEDDLRSTEHKLKSLASNDKTKANAGDDVTKQHAEQVKTLTARSEKEKASLLKDKSELEAQVAHLRDNAKNAERSSDKMVSDLRGECEEKADQLAKLEKEKRMLLVDKEELEDDLEELTSKVKRLESQLADSEKAKAAHAGDVDKKAGAALAQAQAKERDLQREADAHKAKLKSAEDESAKLRSQLQKEVDAHMAKLQSVEAEREKAKSELQREIDGLHAKLRSVEAEALESAKRPKSAEGAQLRAKDELLQKAEVEKRQLRDEIDVLKKKVSGQHSANEDRAKLEAENARLAKEVEDLKAKLAEQKTTVAVGDGGSVIAAALDSKQSPSPKLSHPTANRAQPKRAHKTQNAAKLLEDKREKELGEALKKEAQEREETEEEREERERQERAEKAKRMAAASGGGMGMMAMGGLAAAAAAAQKGRTKQGNSPTKKGRGK